MRLKNMKRSEDTEQIQVVEWAMWNTGRYPELRLLHHCPNGGSRHAAEAGKLKAMGVKAGIPDLCLPIARGAYNGLYIEMKYGRNTLSEHQKDMLRLLAGEGHYCAVCYSYAQAVKIIEHYCKLKRPNLMPWGNLTIHKDSGIAEFPYA